MRRSLPASACPRKLWTGRSGTGQYLFLGATFCDILRHPPPGCTAVGGARTLPPLPTYRPGDRNGISVAGPAGGFHPALLHQPPARGVRGEPGVALVAIVHLVHLVDRVEVADDVRRAERLAGLDRFAVDLLDHHDDPPGSLAAPSLVHDRRIERQPGQPRAVLAGLLVAQVIGANEVRRRPVRVAAVAVLEIRRERGEELARRDAHPRGAAQVTQVDLAEGVPLLVADAPRRVVAEEHLVRVVDTVDLVHEDEVPLALGEDDQLRPPRAGLAARGGVFVLVGRLHGDEVAAADHLGP